MVAQARRVIEIEVIADEALRKLGGIESAAKGAEKNLSLLQRQVNSLGTAFKGLVGFLGVSEFVHLADAVQDIEARLSSVSGSVTQGNAAFEELLDIALRLGVGIEGLAGAYTKLGVAVPTASQEELIQGLDVVSTVLATTGASVQQVNAVLLQFSQAMGSSALQGDEFRSVAENAPVLLRAWREAIGETDTSFRELSASAKLTTESFFENLDAIQELTVEMIGMSEPPLTVARALENLRTQMIALIGDSDGISGTFALLANAIQLVAENLEFLVNVALAFGGLKLIQTLGGAAKEAKGLGADLGQAANAARDAERAASGFAGGIKAAAVEQTLFLAATDAWLGFVDLMGDLSGRVKTTAGAFGLLRSAINSTVGQFLALLAAIEAISFAWERWAEAAGQQDRFIESARTTSELIRTQVDDIENLRELLEKADQSAPSEVTAGFETLENNIAAVERRIVELNAELDKILGRGRGTYFETVGLSQQEVDFVATLKQELEFANRILEAYENSWEDAGRAAIEAENRAEGAARSFSSITAEVKAFSDAASRLSREKLDLEFDLELAGITDPLERFEVEVRQSFDRVAETTKANIEDAASQIRFLQQQRATVALTPEELQRLDSAIAAQSKRVDEAAAALRANEVARQENTAGLIAQRVALSEAEKEQRAMAEAIRLTADEWENSVYVQLALQRLYEEGSISADRLAEALSKLHGEAESGTGSISEAERAYQSLEEQLARLRQDTATGELRLGVLVSGGAEGLREFDIVLQGFQAYERALSDVQAAGGAVTKETRTLARAIGDATEQTLRNAAALESVQAAQQNRAQLQAQYAEQLRATARAEDALRAFRRGGAEGLEEFEKRLELQTAFNEALELQGTNVREASQSQIDAALQVTDAVEKQLRVQEELNNAIKAEQDLARFKARVSGIGAEEPAAVTAGISGARTIEETLDRAVSAQFRGENAEARALLDLAILQAEQFSDSVDRIYDQKMLEGLKEDIERAGERIFAAPDVQDIDFSVIDQAIAQQEFAAQIVFDPASVQNAIAQLQASVAQNPITVPVQGAPVPAANQAGGGAAGIAFGTGLGIPPGVNLAEALGGAASAVGAVP